MKSARERAAEHIRFADDYEGSQLTTAQLIERLAESFREHARDQREECAGVVVDSLPAGSADYYPTLERVRSSVRNAPAPGEGR